MWAHINLGKIFDITGQRDRAVNEYNLAMRTKDDTQGAQEEASKYLKSPLRAAAAHGAVARSMRPGRRKCLPHRTGLASS